MSRVVNDSCVIRSNRFSQVCDVIAWIWQLCQLKVTVDAFYGLNENDFSFENVLHEFGKSNLTFGVELTLVPYLLESVLVKRTFIESRYNCTQLLLRQVILGREGQLSEDDLYFISTNLVAVVGHMKILNNG